MKTIGQVILAGIFFWLLLGGHAAFANNLCEPPFCVYDETKIYGGSGERFALVIGNSHYPGNTELSNPQHDAEDISVKLAEMGFQVETLVDASHASMKEAVSRFGGKLLASPKTVGLFFFAGHGMQQNDQNFLIPVDTVDAIQNSGQVQGLALSLNEVVTTMNQGGVSIIILDACRNNPMGETLAGSGRTLQRNKQATAAVPATAGAKDEPAAKSPPAAIGPGLAQPPKATNRALFAYATSPGDTAQDGTGHNSPFTSGLLQTIRKEHRLEEVFAETSESVLNNTHKKQKPWLTHSLGDVRFYF